MGGWICGVVGCEGCIVKVVVGLGGWMAVVVENGWL